ncbi:hypothetical protein P9152_05360 [Bacillus subtilis]|uniref:hypothetical protein n=1 Tax=Bacillus subtilis group TaxID=653685 RepID=UPI002DB65EF8|nr:hypothetical protein [Bacillus subtilis]MEC3619792.1 hypothetical protein [Bacillus subtilis]MEC3634269.1 hypothetical protein [Bacillus subtilis]MEC3644897.1 hypothetical protein [Bacillus subtilis]MEC3645990.1 hypothetical protein [Bacillus subtilis]MEC3699861.1 hypothetical protein [Bacillus subtilis]
MYYFYEISTLNYYDRIEKEYKTIEHIIFDILKNIEDNQYAMYAYSVSNKDSNDCIYSANLKTNTLFNHKKISFMKTSAEEYENTIVAHENIILVKKDVELKDILSRVHLTEKTIVRDLLNVVLYHIEIIDSETIKIGSINRENILNII